MTAISRIGPFRQARVEASALLAVYRNGRLRRSGRGLATWYYAHGATSLVEIPADDRDNVISVSATTRDFQAVSVQGLATWRAADPIRLAERVDFSVDPETGVWRADPIAQVEALIDGLFQSAVEGYVAARPIAAVLDQGIAALSEAVEAEIAATPRLADIGLALAGFRLANLTPSPELVRALRQPTIEKLQQGADEATFARRAAAVEKEAAIAENETRARIRLEEERAALIARERDNALARAQTEAETARIAAESESATSGIAAAAEADAVRITDAAKLMGERARAEIAAAMPEVVVIAEALKQGLGAAHIGTLNLGPDVMAQLATQFGAALQPRGAP